MSIFNSKYLVWIALGLPAIPIVADFYYDERYYSELMYDTGLLSIQFLMVSLLATPLFRLARRQPKLLKIARWFVRQRRYVGVASFLYAGLHMLVYFREYPDLADILLQATDLEIITGWGPFFVFIALALTSNQSSVNAMGRHWKTLHRLVYPATIIIFLHWYLIGFFLKEMMYYLLPSLFLLGFRLPPVIKRLTATIPTKLTN